MLCVCACVLTAAAALSSPHDGGGAMNAFAHRGDGALVARRRSLRARPLLALARARSLLARAALATVSLFRTRRCRSAWRASCRWSRCRCSARRRAASCVPRTSPTRSRSSSARCFLAALCPYDGYSSSWLVVRDYNQSSLLAHVVIARLAARRVGGRTLGPPPPLRARAARAARRLAGAAAARLHRGLGAALDVDLEHRDDRRDDADRDRRARPGRPRGSGGRWPSRPPCFGEAAIRFSSCVAPFGCATAMRAQVSCGGRRPFHPPHCEAAISLCECEAPF